MSKVGLVLGGGAVRGASHIGVLKALERHGVSVDRIVGTSMGGVIGGLYAAGISPADLEDFIRKTSKFRLLDVGIRKRGLIAGNSLHAAMCELLTLQGKRSVLIEEMPIPFQAVAVDLMEGKQVIFNEGDLLTALRATTAFPGIFSPMMHNGKMLVDGGVLNNFPVDVLDRDQVCLVIAVDVAREHEKRPPRNLFEVMYRSYSLMTAERKHGNLRLADVVIRPEVGSFPAFDFTKWEKCVEAGEEATERIITELKRKLGEERESYDPLSSKN